MQLIADARVVCALAGAAVTVAASAVAAAIAASSGNVLAFFMYELLFEVETRIRSLGLIGREKGAECWGRGRGRPQVVSASTQLRVSVNWWKRTALPPANFQTCANGTSSGLPLPLALAV